MKLEEWAVLVIFILSCLMACFDSSDNDNSEDDYQEINRSINGVAL